MSNRNSHTTRQASASESSSVPARTSLDLGRMLGQLYDSRLTLALITGTFTVLAVLYALLATPIYKADALVQVEEGGGNMNPLRDVSSLLRGEAPPSEPASALPWASWVCWLVASVPDVSSARRDSSASTR